MKSLFLLSTLVALAFAQYQYGTLQISSIYNITYNAGETVTVTWSITSGTPTFRLNIDLINRDKLFNVPYSIATGVTFDSNGYTFTIPTALSTGANYRIYVWGAIDSKNNVQVANYSPWFSINNPNGPVSQFTIYSPVSGGILYQCEQNTISWDVPPLAAAPNTLNIYLYSKNSGNQLYVLTRAAVTKNKQFSFTLPTLSNIPIANNTYFLTIHTEYVPPNLTPGSVSTFGGNTNLFSIYPNRANSSASCVPQSDANNKIVNGARVSAPQEDSSSSSSKVFPTFALGAILLLITINLMI